MVFRSRHLLISSLLLVIGLAITLLLWDHERRNAERDFQASLDFSLRDVASRIEQRMAAYEQMLRGVQGFFAASDEVARGDFQRYVDSLQLSAEFSGIPGIGLAMLVPAGELDKHVLTLRQAGFPAYRIYPPGERPSYAPIIQIEPFIGRNQRALGYDPLADPVRQKAMWRAANSGSASISRKVRLVLETEQNIQAGCVMYLPLYRPDVPKNTPEERQAALIGWIFAPVRMNDLMASLYGERRVAIEISLHDGVDRSPESMLYASSSEVGRRQQDAREVSEYLSIAGSTWVLTVGASPEFGSVVGRDQSGVILIAGTMLSFLLALVCWQLLAARNLAVDLAHEMTNELRKSEERAHHLAQHDTLTGLPNRALFADRLTHALSLAQRDSQHLALMFIDLDRFKPVNDSFGHAVGDQLLQVVAVRLREAVRASDTVGRIGGDEFVVLLPEIDATRDVQMVASKILESMARPFTLAGHELSISASIGIALYPEHGVDEESLNKAADQAMYRAKDSGRNCIRLAI